MNTAPAADVAILGAGAAGLTLALQLVHDNPTLNVTILERETFPVPETTHKVGESTVELAGHYLRDVLGLGDHLSGEQLDKFGLRVFFSAGGNTDITRRIELGHAARPPAAVGTYQIDRGRLENELARRLAARGVEIKAGVKATRVELGAGLDRHLVHYSMNGQAPAQLEARWIIDATGRTGLLKRQLGLTKKNAHHANAVWFRIDHPIDIDTWSNDPRWRGRIVDGRRELSTNHLMGEGYWVWMIRLASGGISIGIVTDPALHPFDELNKFDRALEWLRRYEPQLGAEVTRHRERLLDFRLMADYSYDVQQAFSDRRWALTGESGLFLDPLYSPGLDLIAISNTLTADLIHHDFAGDDIQERAAVHDQVYKLITEGWLRVYQDQYPVMGNARVMLAKVIWDTAVYWGVVGLLYFQDGLADLVDNPERVIVLARFNAISHEIAAFFRQWADLDPCSTYTDEFVRYYDFEFMEELHSVMALLPRGTTLTDQFTRNVRLIEQLSGQMVMTVMRELCDDPRPHVQAQLDQWRSNEVLSAAVDVHLHDQTQNAISDRWVTALTARPHHMEG